MLLLNRKIRSVNLSNNKLNGAAITEIASNLSKARKLETLNLSYNPLTALDAMKLIRHLKLRAVKLKKLLLDNIIVNSDFIEAREKILSLSFRKKAIITHGYVSDRFIPKKLDVRELLLKRADAIGRSAKKKKNRIDVGLLLLELYKINPEPVLAKDFVQIMIRRGVHIDEDFASEMAEAFPGPTKGKIDLAAVEEYMKRLWPDKELPPTPPPEPEPEPEPLPKPKKDKKRKK
uniref:Uncharacterized protein n=1 Tax=Heliothis virescens TaxID=7102 RepID=A0A2A4IY07_HELVI